MAKWESVRSYMYSADDGGSNYRPVKS